jgi:predicted ester cyclase
VVAAQVEDTNVIAGDNGAVIEFIGRGTHTGTLASPMGEIPPTGRRVELPFCEVYRITNGKIVGGSTYFDLAGMLQQLGLMPEQAGPPRT